MVCEVFKSSNLVNNTSKSSIDYCNAVFKLCLSMVDDNKKIEVDTVSHNKNCNFDRSCKCKTIKELIISDPDYPSHRLYKVYDQCVKDEDITELVTLMRQWMKRCIFPKDYVNYIKNLVNENKCDLIKNVNMTDIHKQIKVQLPILFRQVLNTDGVHYHQRKIYKINMTVIRIVYKNKQYITDQTHAICLWINCSRVSVGMCPMIFDGKHFDLDIDVDNWEDINDDLDKINTNVDFIFKEIVRRYQVLHRLLKYRRKKYALVEKNIYGIFDAKLEAVRRNKKIFKREREKICDNIESSKDKYIKQSSILCTSWNKKRKTLVPELFNVIDNACMVLVKFCKYVNKKKQLRPKSSTKLHNKTHNTSVCRVKNVNNKQVNIKVNQHKNGDNTKNLKDHGSYMPPWKRGLGSK